MRLVDYAGVSLFYKQFSDHSEYTKICMSTLHFLLKSRQNRKRLYDVKTSVSIANFIFYTSKTLKNIPTFSIDMHVVVKEN